MPTIASRTPEGAPNRCPICNAVVAVEPSLPGDAPCPACGSLLWFSPRPVGVMCYDYALVAPLREKLLDIISVGLGVNRERITNSTPLVGELHADSLDIVELVMELEEEFKITIPDEQAVIQIKTFGDLIDYFLARGIT